MNVRSGLAYFGLLSRYCVEFVRLGGNERYELMLQEMGKLASHPALPCRPALLSQARSRGSRVAVPPATVEARCGLTSRAQPHPCPLPHTSDPLDARRFDCKLDSPPEITWRNFHHFPLVPQSTIDSPPIRKKAANNQTPDSSTQ